MGFFQTPLEAESFVFWLMVKRPVAADADAPAESGAF
jgi:hypothetical protein